MKAVNQTQLQAQQNEIEAEFQANQQQIADLEAKQARLQQALARYNFHKNFIGKRAIPDYAAWLPFSH